MKSSSDIEVRVSGHAEFRLSQRLRIKSRKVLPFVQKVWAKGTEPSPGWLKQKSAIGHEDVIYKELMGYTFAFAMDEDGTPVLKTILPKKHDNDIL